MVIAIIFNICNGEGAYMTYNISQTTATFFGFGLFPFSLLLVSQLLEALVKLSCSCLEFPTKFFS